MNYSKKNDVIEIIKTKNELLRLIYDFNMNPACYAHRSWIERSIPISLYNRISNSKRGKKKLSNLILRHNDICQDFYCDFLEPKKRLVLLPAEVLNVLTFYGGIALSHTAIKTVIDKIQKEKIIKNIGKQGFQFAISNAPLLIGNIIPKTKTKIHWDDLQRFLQEYGTAFFLSAYSNEPENLYKRLLLKFPMDVGQNINFLEYEFDPSNICFLFLRIMKHVVDQRWQKLVM